MRKFQITLLEQFDANRTRKDFVSDHILSLKPKNVGIDRPTMKNQSSNIKSSAMRHYEKN